MNKELEETLDLILIEHIEEQCNEPASRQQAAQHYYQLGWQVIPLVGKRPVTNWMTDPPLQPSTLRILFEGPSELNIGVKMGTCSRLIGLDIDGQAGAKMFHDTIECDQLPDTLGFMTPNAGYRYLFQYDERIASKSIKLNGKEAIRILSDGTQTVMPPSQIDGRPYTWNSCKALAPWPYELLRELSENSVLRQPVKATAMQTITRADAYARAKAYLAKCDPAISGKGGHNQTFKIAVRLCRGFGLTYHETLDLLVNHYNPFCQPPWDITDLEHKVSDALKVTSAYRNML